VSETALRVTVWGENLHEQKHEKVQAVYPRGMHTTIAEGIRENLIGDFVVRTATLDQPEHGLTAEVLAETDVLTWWGHMGHHLVEDKIVDRVQERVLSGMGLVVLHSGHWSKIFTRLMGTTCALRWRDDDQETVWTVNPGHPIADGIPPVFQIPQQEMYGEYFDIPQPEALVFISSFQGGEVFRSGCCFTRGQGRIFYFSPGHETYPVYYQPEVRRIISNAVKWVYSPPKPRYATSACIHSPVGWFEQKE
jgi:trehalose utilization protein